LADKVQAQQRALWVLVGSLPEIEGSRDVGFHPLLLDLI
jgi:hypothetical protein